jgi:hypothetical protein
LCLGELHRALISIAFVEGSCDVQGRHTHVLGQGSRVRHGGVILIDALDFDLDVWGLALLNPVENGELSSVGWNGCCYSFHLGFALDLDPS